jgi:hypothetical protein
MTGYNFGRRSFLDRLVIERDRLCYGYRRRKKEDIDDHPQHCKFDGQARQQQGSLV